MLDEKKNEYVHCPPFRPSLRGCIGKDTRLAAAVYTCYSEAFFNIADNIHRSLIYRDCDTNLSNLFEELAEADLDRFRLLEELFLALNEASRTSKAYYPCRKRSTCSPRTADSPALEALWERHRNIDCFETLMGRTEDRVVRSVFSKILSAERILCRKLETFCNE